ncbi:MAG: hypothetical protein RR843_00575 [Clostridia bacterium]
MSNHYLCVPIYRNIDQMKCAIEAVEDGQKKNPYHTGDGWQIAELYDRIGGAIEVVMGIECRARAEQSLAWYREFTRLHPEVTEEM